MGGYRICINHVPRSIYKHPVYNLHMNHEPNVNGSNLIPDCWKTETNGTPYMKKSITLRVLIGAKELMSSTRSESHMPYASEETQHCSSQVLYCYCGLHCRADWMKLNFMKTNDLACNTRFAVWGRVACWSAARSWFRYYTGGFSSYD